MADTTRLEPYDSHRHWSQNHLSLSPSPT